MKRSYFWGLLGVLALGGGAWWFLSKKRTPGAGNPLLTPTGIQGNKRGERNNSPCNVTPLPNDIWNGQIGIDTTGDTPYVIFDTPRNGIRAAGVNALSYYLNDGITTLAGFSRWGPLNNGGTYGEDLAKTLGIDSTLTFDVPNNLENLLKAISINENSEVPYTEADWVNGTNDALSAKGLT